jgi:TetR/AcrR family transcriptional regulator, transcriptional repressor of bet genes
MSEVQEASVALGYQVGRLPVKDPFASLHPTAARILQAAQRVLKREGIGGLTLQKISKEAGEHTSLIAYHFGDKAGLMAALIDATTHDRNLEGLRLLSTLPDPPSRARKLVERQMEVANDVDYGRLCFNVLPLLMHDGVVDPAAVGLYEWYFELMLRDVGLWEDEVLRERARPLGALLMAMLDGLSLQKALNFEDDLAPRFEMWNRMVQRELADLLGEDLPGSSGSR